MSLEQEIKRLARDAIVSAFIEARHRYGNIHVTQTLPDTYRHDLNSLAKRLNRSPAFAEKLPIPHHTDYGDTKKKRWWLERDVRAYIENRANLTTRNNTIKDNPDIDPEIQAMLLDNQKN